MTMLLMDALKKKIERQKELDSSIIIMKKAERNLLAQREKRRQRFDEERKDHRYKRLRNRGVVLEQSPNNSAIKLVDGDSNNKSLLLESFEPT